jgi:hypothetical protein
MLASTDYWSRLANYLLLYDQIIIPTGNFQLIAVLRLMLGDAVFDELIHTKVIVFARFDQWFGYAGNGAGLVFFQIKENPNLPERRPDLGIGFYGPLDEAIETAIRNTNPPSSEKRRSELTNLLLENVITLSVDQMAKELKEESYRDIQNSPYLRDFLALRNAGRSLDNLLGPGPAQLSIFNPHYLPTPTDVPEIRAVLRVAFENFLLRVGGQTQVGEITGDDTTLSILKAKGQRLGFAAEGVEAFTQIQNVNGVPDIGVAFGAKALSPAQLIELRHSTHAQALRDWFAAGSPIDSSEDIMRRYVDSLGKPSWLESVPMKLLRFAVTTSAGVLGPVAGAAVSLVDAFLLSKWFPGRSPRLFLKHAKVILTAAVRVPSPVARSRDRNRPCGCGSGKKSKNCCGRPG